MNILITNVSNLESNELRVFATLMMKRHHITVASTAVAGHQKGSAFSFGSSPVQYKKIGNYELAGELVDAYKFYGTPADMMSIMINEVMKDARPDLVICGINNGLTLGTDTFCSSNIGMVMQAVFAGIPALAVAVPIKLGGHSIANLIPPATFILNNAEAFKKMGTIPNTFINISCPIVPRFEDYRGYGVGSMDKLTPLITYQQGTDPNGEGYFWTEFVERNAGGDGGEHTSGLSYFEKNYIIVTPLSVDCTDYKQIEELKKPKPAKKTKEVKDENTAD